MMIGLLAVGSSSVVVLANDAAIEAVRAKRNVEFGVPFIRSGNNQPEQRRNKLIADLGDVIGAASAHDLSSATHVHSAGYVHFFETGYSRWQSELSSDASYLLPGANNAEDAPTLVPFHCAKSSTPRSSGLAAEFACYMSDFETPLCETTARTLRDDLGVVEASVEHLVSSDGVAYALTTHPGHHAGPGYSSGFCYFNNACVACSLLQQTGLEPALLDLDFHGGNGSLDCAEAMSLWFKSLHCAGAYPWVDMDSQGVEIAPGTGWASGYAAALEAALASLPASTSVLVVSMGYDTLATDPEAGKRAGVGLGLEPPNFYAMGEMLAGACRKVLIVQEGGYDLHGAGEAAKALVAGLTAHAEGELAHR